MPSDAVIISFITVVGGIVLAVINKRLKNARPRKDRVDGALDTYEALIKRINDENIQLRTDNAKLLADNVRLKEGENG